MTVETKIRLLWQGFLLDTEHEGEGVFESQLFNLHRKYVRYLEEKEPLRYKFGPRRVRELTELVHKPKYERKLETLLRNYLLDVEEEKAIGYKFRKLELYKKNIAAGVWRLSSSAAAAELESTPLPKKERREEMNLEEDFSAVFKKIEKRDRELSDTIPYPPTKRDLKQVETLLIECNEKSDQISSLKERSDLRKIINYWSNFIYQWKEYYPYVPVKKPANQEI